MVPRGALRPLDDPAGEQITRCLERLAHRPALAIRFVSGAGLGSSCRLWTRNSARPCEGSNRVSPTARKAHGQPSTVKTRAVLSSGSGLQGNLLRILFERADKRQQTFFYFAFR